MKINNICRFFIILIASDIAVFMLASCSPDKAVTLSEVSEAQVEITEVPAETGETVNEDLSDEEPETAMQPDEKKVCVYICGQVADPGVYELDEGSRVCDALEAAGGLLPEADEGRINLAGMLTDGEMIYFPKAGEEIPVQQTQSTSSGSAQTGALININTAGVGELTSLPGIGQAKADAIVKYRDENGAFRDIKEIKNVPGIGDALFSGIEDLICI